MSGQPRRGRRQRLQRVQAACGVAVGLRLRDGRLAEQVERDRGAVLPQVARSARTRRARRLADDEAVRHVAHAGRRGRAQRRPARLAVADIRIAAAIGGGALVHLVEVRGQVTRQVVEDSCRPASRRRSETAPRAAPGPAAAISIAFTSSALSGCRGLVGNAAWIERPTLCSSSSTRDNHMLSARARLGTRPPLALRGRDRGGDLGRDRLAVRGRGARHARPHLPGRRPPLRARLLRRPAAGHVARVRGRARRRARLAGRRRLPAQRLPHLPEGGPLQVVFGSCRVAAPHEPPYSLRKDADERGREVDALHTLAQRMARPAARAAGRTCC